MRVSARLTTAWTRLDPKTPRKTSRLLRLTHAKRIAATFSYLHVALVPAPPQQLNAREKLLGLPLIGGSRHPKTSFPLSPATCGPEIDRNAKPLSMSAPNSSLGRVGILWRGDAEARRTASPVTSRFHDVFAALAEAGIATEPVVYEDDVADEVRSQLSSLDGVLVWVNPLHEGRNRAKLDALLREVAAQGPWVSTHPDVTLKMGTKEVLYATRSMSWGGDVDRYDTLDAMRAALPARLAAGPRVIKRNRGNNGIGVWKVEAVTSGGGDRMIVRVLDATAEAPEELPMDDFLAHCADYFQNGQPVIDQPFQPRLTDGVVRCYMAGDRCAGFGAHKVKALVESAEARSKAGPRLYSSNEDPRFQRLRRLMEDEWTPQMCKLLEIAPRDLPIIWDADFMLGPTDGDGGDTYVLGEINVSSVFPIPEEAPAEIAWRVAERLRARL